MRLKINQIICSGKLKFKKPVEEILWNKKKFKFYQNSVSITRYNFNAHICQNISQLFNNNIRHRLRETIESVTDEKLTDINLKISNIQHSTRISYDKNTLITQFLVLLNSNFEINKIEITQEANFPATTTSLEELLVSRKINYLSLIVKFLKSSATLRLQLDKTKTFTHITLIITNLKPETRRFVQFIEDHDGNGDICQTQR